MSDMQEIFGEVIHSYTREQALADGVLVDVSEMAKEAGFVIPTAITQALHQTLIPNETEKRLGQDYEDRLWDVLYLASLKARRNKRESRSAFELMIAEKKFRTSGRLKHRIIRLWLDVGPGDQAEPVVTIGYPEDF